MNISLARISSFDDAQTFGVLSVDNVPLYVTCERPWLDNQRKVSCIPEGSYVCQRVQNRTLGGGQIVHMTYEVENVPNRSGILFHSGNDATDTEGCILLGMSFGLINNLPSITNSHTAVASFLVRTMEEETFNLTVRRA